MPFPKISFACHNAAVTFLKELTSSSLGLVARLFCSAYGELIVIRNAVKEVTFGPLRA